MNESDKKSVFNKFTNNREITERQALRNKGVTVFLGDTTIDIKALPYEDANDLEDKILEMLGKLYGLRKLDTNIGDSFIEEISNSISTLLRNDLIDLVKLCTINLDQPVTKEIIIKNKATKDDLIQLVIESLLINYSHVKNLIALARGISN
jgi:hypothetical protein